jgi:Uma2 family endonuclease
MDIPRIRMTNEQYMAMPDDGKRYELHDGVLKQKNYGVYNGVEMASPTVIHNWIVSMLLHLLMLHVFNQKLGYVFGDNLDYLLDQGLILKPDVSFMAAERVTTLPNYFREAPDLAVEVISPSNTASEMFYKVETYLRHGSRLVWIVDPQEKIVMVYSKGDERHTLSLRLNINDTLTGGDVLPEFRLPLSELFGSIPSEG